MKCGGESFVGTRGPESARHGFANEVRNRTTLATSELAQPFVHRLIEIELRPHHAMYIHRQWLEVNPRGFDGSGCPRWTRSSR
jgi:hypothetical protein